MLGSGYRSVFLALSALLLPALASAQLAGSILGPAGAAPNGGPLSVTVSATGEYEYNSNVFDLQEGVTLPGLPQNSRRSDSIYTVDGALAVRYSWRQQALFANASVDHVAYNDYTGLNHDNYRFDGGWSGKFGDAVDGNLEVIRTRSMVPFLYVIQQSKATISTEQREQGGLGLQILPELRLEGSAYRRDVRWPLPGEPNLDLKESQGQLALRYLGAAAWSAGVSVGYVHGDYTGATIATQNPPYDQTTEDFVASYKGNRSSFNGELGYTSRTSPAGTTSFNNASGVTGRLQYVNQLTGKTSMTLGVARQINSYVTNAGAQIDDTATLTLHWQWTYKTGVGAGYNYMHSLFPHQGNAAPGADRLDHVQQATLRVDYEPLRWLAVRPFVTYQKRTSNLFGSNFDDEVYGVDLTVLWQK